ncbi:MerR family transcriptional regulator [Actinocrispum wychmicini]|uniref:DNA-binding transcriptional MerR regulator n=1 Tax=Actinocrispum wychmicini TaxID=1213861 RepID=A0A4R2JKJ3_9PSEU|nr:MerR family transcriptional regulator [Actinocrispum wychmicini]TCO59674.1 DNA-binding transcriptional MerR regulator [Actinocrispum wychmicini]
MTGHLSIGDFSRATHLTIKTLRHYHRIGLLEPADVDPHTGYRRYTTEQLPTVQVIRRFRDLDMPLEEIQAILATPDPRVRTERIVMHLKRLEEHLGRTQRAVGTLRDLLVRDAAGGVADVELRSAPAVPAAVITETVAAEDAATWQQGALGELYATLAAQQLPHTGPAGGLYADEVFTHAHGQVTIFLPCAGPVQPMGRVSTQLVPAAELAVMAHDGPPTDVDRTYSALATYVARHAISVDGPIREYYVVGQRDTADTTQWRTEVGWPVFLTGAAVQE